MKQRTVFICTLLCALFQLAAGESVDPFTPPAMMRWPVVTVPVRPGPSHIDGDITKAEWMGSTKLQDFVTLEPGDDNGVAAPEQTEVFLSYNEQALHIGFRVHMQQGITPLVTITEGHDTAFTDDAFEIFLRPENSPNVLYHFGGNAAGVSWDRKLTPQPEWEWNPKVQYHAKIEAAKGWWSGEWVIPWSEFPVPMPKEGEVWQANFVTNRRAPAPRLDTWSYWRKWLDNENDGHIIFGGTERPSFAMGFPIAEAWKGRGALPSIANLLGEKHPRKVRYEVKLYRKNKPGGNSFLKDLQTRRDKASGEGATFATYAQDLADTLKEYTVIHEGNSAPTPLPAPKFGLSWGPRIRVDQLGDYLLAYAFYDITNATNQFVIAGGAIPFRIRSGVEAETFPFILTRRSVVIAADMRAVERRAAVRKLRGEITEIGQTNVLAQTIADYNGKLKQEVEVSAESLPIGKEYQTHLQVLDESGMVMSEALGKFNRPPDPDWWLNREKWGSEPEVPKPWTPIVWQASTGKVWDREVTFGNSPLPMKIVNQGNAILARPIRLELKAGGKVQSWRGEEVKLIEHRPGQVVFETKREAAGVKIIGRTQFEFDGFSLIDLEIAPVTGKAQIDSLDLVVSVKAEYAEFLTNYRNAPGPGKPINRYVGKTPEHYESPVMLTTWLGNDRGGLEWSCESSRDWFLSKPDKAIEVNRANKVVEARFHLIDGSMTLDRPRHIRFGLVATPTKPVPVEFRNLRVDNVAGAPPVPGETRLKDGAIATEKDLKQFRDIYGMVDVFLCLAPYNWSGYEAWHPPLTDPKRIDAIRNRIRLAKDAGQRILWNGGWAVAPFAPQWDPWGREMVAWPITPTFANQYDVSYASPYVEFMVGAWRSHVRQLGMQGIRFDTVVPWMVSENPYLGETWVGDDGKAYGSQSLFRQREMFKRIFRLFHGGETDDGLIYLPLAGPPIMAVESFVDIHEIGEGFYMRAKSLKEGYPQDAVRVWMSGKPYGFLEANNLKGNPLHDINRLGPLLVADATPRWSARAGFNAPTYTPSGWQEVPTVRIWEAWSWINRATARWCPHWENKSMISTRGSGEHYVSFYLQTGRRMLLVAANYEKETQQVRVKLNRKSLGFKPDTQLEAQDAVTLEKVAVKDDTLVLDILPELFRMVKISSKER